MANYRRELRIGINIRKEKMKKAIESAERMKVQEEAEAVLRKVQEKMK